MASILARFGGRDPDEPEPEPVRPPFEPPPPGVGIGDVTAMALDTMGALITRYRLAALPPDVVVTVPGDAAKTMDFHRADELIELGKQLTEAALDDVFGLDDVAELDSAEPVAAIEPGGGGPS